MGKVVSVSDYPTSLDTSFLSNNPYQEQLADIKGDMRGLQEKLYRSMDRSLLLVLQGMDASGKDSLIEELMSGLSPIGLRVTSFKRPTEEELSHDFLWRHEKELPSRGGMEVWNRSHYEEVFMVRVNPELLQGRGIPPHEMDHPFWDERLGQIAAWERENLNSRHITTIKIYLNLSKKEQKARLLSRLERKDKQWKFEAADLTEREKLPLYLHAISDAVSKTSTEEAPWYIVPADKKSAARILVGHIINYYLGSFELTIPPSPHSDEQVQEWKRQLRNNA